MAFVSTKSRHWSAWAAYAAAGWSLLYGALGVYWMTGGGGFPFGAENDSGARLSILAGARRDVVAPTIAALGLVGALVGVALARARVRGASRLALLVFAWTAALGLAVLIPDFRVLVVIAYAPIILIGAPFGWPGGVSLRDAVPWPILNQAVCVVGGLLWAAAAIAYQRRSHGACVYCGRSDVSVRWTTPAAARRWGGWATAVAVAIPVIYALTRWAWALGFPLGITDKFFREGQAIGLWWRGAALATLALGGAVLTRGLTRPWSETFPRWIPFAGGRPVPMKLVVIPATAVAVIVTAAGLMFIRMALSGTFMLGDNNRVTLRENWAALWPELLWPLWGIALVAATLAYYYRVRGRCHHCG